MRRDCLQEISKESFHRCAETFRRKLGVEPVDQIDQLAMLVIDGCDPDAVLILPLQKRHALLRKPCALLEHEPAALRAKVDNEHLVGGKDNAALPFAIEA